MTMTDERIAAIREQMTKYRQAVYYESQSPDGMPICYEIADKLADEAIPALLEEIEQLQITNADLSGLAHTVDPWEWYQSHVRELRRQFQQTTNERAAMRAIIQAVAEGKLDTLRNGPFAGEMALVPGGTDDAMVVRDHAQALVAQWERDQFSG